MSVRFGVIAVVVALWGAVAGVIWHMVVELPAYVIQSDGRAILSQPHVRSIFHLDAFFAVMGLVVGLAIGALVWFAMRRVGWPVAFIAAGAALLAAATCMAVASMMGPGELEPRLAAASPGDLVPLAFTLHAPSAVATWAFGALLVPMVASAVAREPKAQT